MKKSNWISVFLGSMLMLTFAACQNDDIFTDIDDGTTTIGTGTNTGTDTGTDTGNDTDCTKGNGIDRSRGECNEVLSYAQSVNISTSGDNRVITTNNIPEHAVGKFGGGTGSLNPNAISPQSSTYRIDLTPQKANSTTSVINDRGPQYSFGVLLNGVEVDPAAAEPFPHERGNFADANWEWNLEAINVRIGLDCNNAHVQPTGKYHYHGLPTLLIEDMVGNAQKMTLLGYAADGFPIYNRFAFANASDSNSGVKAMAPSYRLKQGERPGDGESAPCGTYNGVYTNDYEYVAGLGDLDQCNGRTGVTPEFPNGTYYYVITEDFPAIPRCFVGTPSTDFKIGR